MGVGEHTIITKKNWQILNAHPGFPQAWENRNVFKDFTNVILIKALGLSNGTDLFYLFKEKENFQGPNR